MRNHNQGRRPGPSKAPRHGGRRPGQRPGQRPKQQQHGRPPGFVFPSSRPPSTPPSIESLAALMKKSLINLKDSQLNDLWRYHNLLRARNQDRELTRIVGFEPMVIKHYVDCMIIGDIWKIPSPIVDIGTGAGFPGIPLKIRYPGLKMILAEPRPKRIEFLNEAIKTLRMSNISVFEHKVVSRSFTQPVKAVITRAVETMDKTILRSSGSVQAGTELIFLKGPNVGRELRDALRRFGRNFELVLDQAYVLPHTNNERRLVVLRCIKPITATEAELSSELDESTASSEESLDH